MAGTEDADSWRKEIPLSGIRSLSLLLSLNQPPLRSLWEVIANWLLELSLSFELRISEDSIVVFRAVFRRLEIHGHGERMGLKSGRLISNC